jgi:hypothetical protein
MRFAYADPPYVGQARKHYQCDEIDHRELIAQLMTEYPDGWALSLSSPSLREILPMCPDDVRVAAWTKSFASFKPNVNPAYAWEPIIIRGGRKRTREQYTMRDWVNVPITLEKGLVGAKPGPFVYWLIEFLNMQPDEDELVDLYPGTGVVSRVVQEWRKTRGFDFPAKERPADD